MGTKDIQEFYQIKLHSMDTILHQISLMDQVENEQELSEIIHSLLQAIGNYTGADRVYVFDWETDQKDSLSNTFEWCADEVTPEIANLQAIPVSLMPNWVKRFENKEAIVINDLEATKYSEPEEYELLKTQEICSLIAVPIYANHQMNGFIGVGDTPTRVLANGRGFLRHGRTPQRAITSPLHPVTSLPLSRLFCGCLF